MLGGTHSFLRNTRLVLSSILRTGPWLFARHIIKDSEIARLKDLFRQNGYSEQVVNRCIDKKLSTWSSEKVIGSIKCPMYIRLPYIGDVSYRFEGQIRKAIDRCHSTIDSRVIFEPHRMLPKVQKNVIPAIYLSNVVYEFVRVRCSLRR